MEPICDDLRDETAALAAIVEPLTEEQWRLPTVAEGWDTAETIFHLAASDRVALMAVVDRPAFLEVRDRMMRGETSLHGSVGRDSSEMTGAELWRWFVELRGEMISAFRGVEPRERLAWLGPDIGARSLATSRLLETWSHAHDVADTFGVSYPQTDRLRHIAHIGFVTRDFSYTHRGLTPPSEPVRVELRSPDGDVWTWGPDDAAQAVVADAAEFCKVVTHRLAFADSSVRTDGPLAAEWMQIAQPWIEPETISDRA